jgi:hypothetical protein
MRDAAPGSLGSRVGDARLGGAVFTNGETFALSSRPRGTSRGRLACFEALGPKEQCSRLQLNGVHANEAFHDVYLVAAGVGKLAKGHEVRAGSSMGKPQSSELSELYSQSRATPCDRRRVLSQERARSSTCRGAHSRLRPLLESAMQQAGSGPHPRLGGRISSARRSKPDHRPSTRPHRLVTRARDGSDNGWRLPPPGTRPGPSAARATGKGSRIANGRPPVRPAGGRHLRAASRDSAVAITGRLHDLVGPPWKRDGNERMQPGEIPPRPDSARTFQNRTAMRLAAIRRNGTKASGSPVTPEVAGSSPVAPVRSCRKSDVFISCVGSASRRCGNASCLSTRLRGVREALATRF